MNHHVSLTEENLDRLGLRTEAAMSRAREYILSKFANSYSQIFQECMDSHTRKAQKASKFNNKRKAELSAPVVLPQSKETTTKRRITLVNGLFALGQKVKSGIFKLGKSSPSPVKEHEETQYSPKEPLRNVRRLRSSLMETSKNDHLEEFHKSTKLRWQHDHTRQYYLDSRSDLSVPFNPLESYQMTMISLSDNEDTFTYGLKNQRLNSLPKPDLKDNFTTSYTSNDCPTFRWTPHRLF